MSQFTGATTNHTTGASLVVAAALAALPVATLAADEPVPGFLFNATTELRYDDNVYRTESNEQSDGIAVFKPELAWVAPWAASQFVLGYQGDFGRYFNESDLNYNDNAVVAYLRLNHSAKLRTDYNLGYKRQTDKPGSTDDLFLEGEKPVKWRNSRAGLRLDYGSTGSQGQLALQARYNEQRYASSDEEYRDYDGTGGTLTFYYRVAPKTRVLLEADYIDYGYIEDDIFGIDQSGDNAQLLAGVTWEATGKTTGVFKIGYRNRTYNDDRFDKQSGLALFLDGIWRPNTYTTVTFGAAQDNQNSGQRGTGGSVRAYGYIAVVRDITELTRLKVDVRYTNEDFDDFLNRDDDRWDTSLGLEYSLVDWLDVGLAYRSQDRDSNVDIFDFTSNIIVLTASTRFGE
jgi:hypothetical protein